jgi:hypothetical protein
MLFAIGSGLFVLALVGGYLAFRRHGHERFGHLAYSPAAFIFLLMALLYYAGWL